MSAEPNAHKTLQNVEVWIAVSLDEDGPIFKDGDVPTDDHSIVELTMRLDGKIFDLLPVRHHTPLNGCSRVGMDRKPTKPGVCTEIARLGKGSCLEID